MASNLTTVLAGLTIATGLVLVGGIVISDSADTGNDPAANAEGIDDTTDSAKLEIVNGSFPGWIRESEQLNVSVSIANRGTTDSSQTVELGVDDDGDGELERTIATRDVTIPKNEVAHLSFGVDPPSAGEYQFGIATTSTSQVGWSVQVFEPPKLSIANADQSLSVVNGTTANISATVVNEGDFGERSVRLVMDSSSLSGQTDGEVIRETSVTLPGDDERAVSFAVPTDELAPGTYTYGIETDAASVEGELQVLRPANFELAAVKSPGNVTRGDIAEVSVDVTNTGDATETQTVRLVGPGSEGLLRRVELTGGESKTLSFAIDTETLARGTHEYRISSDDDQFVASSDDAAGAPPLQVRDANFAVTDVRGNATVYLGDRMVVGATVNNTGNLEGAQAVVLEIDADQDGQLEPHDIRKSVTLSPGEETTVPFDVSYLNGSTAFDAAGSPPLGTYTYGISTGDTDASTTARELQIRLRPATFQIEPVDTALNVTQGANATISVNVTNTGHLNGTQTVTLAGPNIDDVNRTLTLEAGESETVLLNLSTDDIDRGTYDYTLSTDDDEVTATPRDENGSTPRLRVRDGHFEVHDVRGNETLYVGDRMTFAADVTNTGDITATQTVELKIDITDDDQVESHGITKNVTLAPGEETTVRFWVPYMEDPDPLKQVENLPTGTYLYGIYSEDTGEKGVFDARSKVPAYQSTTSSEQETTTEPLYATLDEISQEKWGYDYDELSGETKRQMEEIHDRQPFADGRGITDVLTREEIARYEYGLDVKIGSRFEFEKLDVDIQQQIEADFEAQFTEDTGDRIESWDELAQIHYDSEYEELSESEKQHIKELYWAQFESEE